MINMKRFIIFMCLLAFVGCGISESQRVDKPAFKGMELYSWKPAAKDWHFCLLVGTNRLKSISEITAPETTIVGVDKLKQKLSRLAKGEQVFWKNMAKEPVPRSIKRELKKYSEIVGIHLHLPTT